MNDFFTMGSDPIVFHSISRAQVVSAGGLRRRPQAVRAPSPEGIPKMNDFFTMGSDPIVLR